MTAAAEHDERGLWLSVDEKDALITDPVNRGLTSAQVVDRLGRTIAGSRATVQRVRTRARLDGQGYPLHASHHHAEALPAPADPQDERDETDGLMRDGRGTRPTGNSRWEQRGRLRTAPTRRWPDGECVYFIRAADGGPIKIGCTRNLTHRYADLAASSPVPLTVVGFIHGYRPTEQHLHRLFAPDRLHGEWFRPSERLVALAEGRLFLAANGRLRPRMGQLGDS